jgi:hypothetical protein
VMAVQDAYSQDQEMLNVVVTQLNSVIRKEP